MSNIFDELGLDQEVYNKAEEQTVREAFEVLPSGAYKAEIKELATFTTENGAGMLKAIVVIPEKDNREITIYQNTKKKDGSPNEIGTATFKHIIQATNVDSSTLSTKTETIKAYGKDVEGKVVKGLNGKPFLALVRAVHEEGAKFEDYNEIEAYARVDGTNAKSEDILTTFNEKIEKTPILNRKAKNPQANSSDTQAATSGTAKNVADML